MTTMDDLPELINIIDEIVAEEEVEEVEVVTEENQLELFETCLHLVQEYMDANPNTISDPDFREIISDDILEILDWLEELDFLDEEYLCDMVDGAVEYYFEYICLERSSTTATTATISAKHLSTDQYIIELEKEEEQKHKKTKEQIAYLESLPQPAQRTPEWYTYRHNLITASNAYKAFDSQAGKNALIYEKCKPISMLSSGNASISSPMHWGQKYEAVSVSIYESKYNATIKDFGCIQHRTYPFIGASPDGINTDESSPNYGRMLEIKNPTTRVITGEPKKEYWVQCQLQMETCDLDECDFLETKFAEYESEEEFLSDGTFFISSKEEMKGIMMYFADQGGVPKYIYKPLAMDKEEFNKWEQEMIEMYENKETHNYTWIKNNYWKLVQLSCVLVKRNVQWFQSNVQALDDLWRIVLQERVTGYEHRAPKPRTKTNDNKITNYMDKSLPTKPESGCLLKLMKNPFTGVVTVIKTDNHYTMM